MEVVRRTAEGHLAAHGQPGGARALGGLRSGQVDDDTPLPGRSRSDDTSPEAQGSVAPALELAGPSVEIATLLFEMTHRLRSDESFELDTFWSRPGPDGRLPTEGGGAQTHGTLRYSPGRGLELTVFDLFPELKAFEETNRVPVLFGETLEHKPCVLFDALIVKTEGNLFGGHHRVVLRAHQFMVGEHVPRPDEVRSQRFQVRLRGLYEWLTASFRVNAEEVLRGLSHEENPEGRSIELQGSRLLLGFEWRERGGRVVEEFATATFEFDEELELQQFFEDWLVPLQDLLVLATQEQSVLQSLLVERCDERRWESLHPAIRSTTSREAWNRWELQVVRTPNVPLARPRQSEFESLLLPAAALADDLEGALRRWHKLRRRLREAGTYFFTSLNQHSPLNRRFLDCMSFAETYHRVNGNAFPSKTRLPEQEHSRLRDLMLAALDDDHPHGPHPHLELYARALGNANRQTNAERISELFARARVVDFGVDLQEETLPARLVATRNYLTHWSSNKNNVLPPVARFHAVRRLTIVLQVNLLLDLGLCADTVKTCVDEGYRTSVWEDEGD